MWSLTIHTKVKVSKSNLLFIFIIKINFKSLLSIFFIVINILYAHISVDINNCNSRNDNF